MVFALLSEEKDPLLISYVRITGGLNISTFLNKLEKFEKYLKETCYMGDHLHHRKPGSHEGKEMFVFFNMAKYTMTKSKSK